MINLNKKILLPTLGLAALIGAGIVGVSAVNADSIDSSSPFVQRLVERFGLNEDEVVSTFQELHEEKKEMMLQSKEERLSQAVEDGVITEEQKQALLEKWEEKKTHREEHRAEMETWMEDQGIDTEALHDYGGFGHKGFGFKHWGK